MTKELTRLLEFFTYDCLPDLLSQYSKVEGGPDINSCYFCHSTVEIRGGNKAVPHSTNCRGKQLDAALREVL